jgi:hypothetical protein
MVPFLSEVDLIVLSVKVISPFGEHVSARIEDPPEQDHPSSISH